MSSKHLVIPDVQVKPGVDISHLADVGAYIADKRPDVIVCIGDFADMPSLSSYDKGKMSFEGRRYKHDIRSTQDAMDALCQPFLKIRDYSPQMVLTLGNHEQRIERAVDAQPELEGLISYADLNYEAWGWEVAPFLEVVTIDGVNYSHYFTSGVMGRPVSSPNALVTKKHQSCIMGHVQQDGIASQYRADGTKITGIFSGCCYTHDEDYLGKQGNNYWRGVWMLHDVRDGEFDPMQVSLKYLKQRNKRRGNK